MRRSKNITIDGLGEVTVKELTVTQVEGLLRASAEERPNYAVELLVRRAIPVEIVMLSTGLSQGQINGDITPTDANLLWDAVAEVNPFLMDLLDRLHKVVEQATTAMPGDRSAAASAS